MDYAHNSLRLVAEDTFYVRIPESFPDSKIHTTKTFRIKCVNRDIDNFATNARKHKIFHKLVAKLPNFSILHRNSGECSNNALKHFSIILLNACTEELVLQLSGQLLDRPDSFWVVRTVWIIRTVLGLSGQFINCPDSFWIFRTVLWVVRTVSRLSGQLLECQDSF